jgi:hypothetical protein
MRRIAATLATALPESRRERARTLALSALRPTASLRPLPGLLIIGGQRCGTTSLYRYLADHPDVAPPRVKEPQWFAHRWSHGPDWYRANFPVRHGGRLTFEASPYYLFHPMAAERAHSVVPNAKIVALLRDPTERAWSHYRHSVQRGRESLPFEQALEAEDARLAGEEERLRDDPSYPAPNHRFFSYFARGVYAPQLRRWMQWFPPEQIKVIRSEDLFVDPTTVFADILTFLGLPPHVPAQFSVHTKSVQVREIRMPEGSRDTLDDRYARHVVDVEQLLRRPMHWA